MAKVRSRRTHTMNDVAKLAGVSQTTVSFVINDAPNANIPEDTRERVRAAIQQLGYRPNVLAQGLRMQRSGTLGFITDEIAITPHAGKILEGAQDAAWENDKFLLLVNTKANPEIEKASVEMLLDRQVEGLIYAAMYHREVNPPVAMRQVPTVLLDCYCDDRSLPSVVPDEIVGGRAATEVLLQKGHRRIGFMNHEASQPATFGRLAGYQQALAAYGVPFDENLVRSAWCDSQGGYRCALELMLLPDPPTALFCFNDRMAMGTYDALRKLNRRIPDDVAVMGFDNQELIAAHLYPPLSTMELPHYQMGAWATQHLSEMIANPDGKTPVQRKIECKFVERASV